ncbi:MAG: hypothetical protein ACREOO_12165 [bacterium]
MKDGKRYLADLEARERARTGIRSLKVSYNKVFGYYLEVTKPNLHLVPPEYIRKQTIVHGERFFTLELKEHESTKSAAARARAMGSPFPAPLSNICTTNQDCERRPSSPRTIMN